MSNEGKKRTADRAYMLLEVSDGKLESVVRALRSMAGIASLDILEGPPDVIMTIEAPGRKRLAELTVQALAAVEKSDRSHVVL